MKRSGLIALSGAAVLLAALATPAMADTATQPANLYAIGGGFSFVERGQTLSGFASFQDDRLHGVQNVSFYFAGSGADRLCDAGTPDDPTDDYTGTEFFEFDPTTTRIVDASIRPDLSAAKLSISMSGVRNRFDACTGVIVEAKHEHHTFTMALKSTSALDTSTDAVLIDNGDGTFSPGTQTYSFRTAAGKGSVDSSPASLTDALIEHVVVTKN